MVLGEGVVIWFCNLGFSEEFWDWGIRKRTFSMVYGDTPCGHACCFCTTTYFPLWYLRDNGALKLNVRYRVTP
jgi:hypothetical protein